MNKTDALEFLNRITKGISHMFGSTCETLIQDMNVPKHPILSIYNGHVTNRKIGSTKDVYGNNASDKTVYLENDFINRLVITKAGKEIKSSTFHLKGDDYHYALGINFDFTYIHEFSKIQNGLIQVESDLQNAITEVGKNKLSYIFDRCVDAIGKPIDNMNRADRIRLISLLKQEKVFSFQKSVLYVSERLQLSRYTIYKYIKETD